MLKVDPTGPTGVWGASFGSPQVADTPYDLDISTDQIHVYALLSQAGVGITFGDQDITIVKLNTADGTKVWIRHFGNTIEDRGKRMIVDSNNKLLISGFSTSPNFS